MANKQVVLCLPWPGNRKLYPEETINNLREEVVVIAAGSTVAESSQRIVGSLLVFSSNCERHPAIPLPRGHSFSPPPAF